MKPCPELVAVLGGILEAAIEHTGDRQTWIGEHGRILRFDKGYWKELSTASFLEEPLLPDLGVGTLAHFDRAAEVAAGKWILVKPNESGVVK